MVNQGQHGEDMPVDMNQEPIDDDTMPQNNLGDAEVNVDVETDGVDASGVGDTGEGASEPTQKPESTDEGPTWAEAEIGADGEEELPVESAPVDEPELTATGVSHVLTQEISTLKAQLDEHKAHYVRIAADFENFRERTHKEREELEQKVRCATITELLPVVDNFERARSQIKPQTDAEMSIHKSYQSVYKQLVDCLKRLGVSPMRAEGTPFDPNLHEAVMREPTDQHPEGTVMEELMRGYMLGDRVIRHAWSKLLLSLSP